MTEEEFEAQLQWAMNYAENYGGRATVLLDFLREVERRNAKLNAVPPAQLLSVKILLERSELRSDIRKDSVRAKNYETACNNVAAWIEEVQP